MSKTSFSKIAGQIEKEGFERGYRQAVKDMRRLLGGALDNMLKAHQPPEEGTSEADLFLPEAGEETPVVERRVAQAIVPPSKLSAEDRVFDTIKSIPGLRGTDVVSALQQTGDPVKERTVRTALWRLKNRKKIELRGNEWYIAGDGKSWRSAGSSEEELPPH